jgi:predicted permease
MLRTIVSDLRFAILSILRHSGFAMICVLIVAIGIGALTTMYSTLNAVVLQPLPYESPERLVWAWSVTEDDSDNSTSAEDYFDYREQCDAFSSLAAHFVFNPRSVFTGQGEPERVAVTIVSANFFETLAVEPMYGRSFAAGEEVLGGPEVVVLSHAFWQRRFGGDPGAVVGSPIGIDGTSYEVIGIMPEGFRYPQGVELWFPMQRGGGAETGRGNNNFFVIGRLADGISIETAQAQVDGVAARIAAEYPQTKEGWGMRLEPLHQRFFGDIRPVMMMMMGAILLVLLIVCANLSSLYLAKVMSRQNELAIRQSLGASPMGVARQLVFESLILALLGAGAGIGLAALSTQFLRTLSILPRMQSIGISGPVLLVTIVAAIVTGLLIGVVPALHGARVQLGASLKEGSRSSTSGGRGMKMRSVLVVAQVALSLMLLIGSGLLIRSMLQLYQVDPGLKAEGVLTVDLELPGARYSSPETREAVLNDLLQRLRALPDVVDAGAADGLPPFGGPYNRVRPVDQPPETVSPANDATRRIVTDDYFKTLGIPLLAGRELTAGDRLGTPPVTVVSQALANGLYPKGDALGSILILPWGDGIPMEIVGIAGDVRDFGLDSDPMQVFYLPMRQYPGTSMRLVVRASDEPTALVPSIRSTVRELEPDAPLSRISTMDAWFARSTADRRFFTTLLAIFAGIAMVLAATGLYGVMAYLVAERTREIGIRMALGAAPIRVLLRVLSSGALLAGTGLLIGLVAAPALAQVLRGILFATAPTDPVTYLGVSGFLVVVVLVACLLPAMRAVRIDPTIALRSE